MADNMTGGNLYIYEPNRGAAIAFAVLFSLSAVGHGWQCWYHHSWNLFGLHPFCAVLFAAGYALRAYGAFGNYNYDEQNSRTLITYILGQVFIDIAPPLLELANYRVLSRLFYYAPYHVPMSAGRVTATFGGLMLLVETLNGIGVAFASNPTTSQPVLGKVLILVSLGLQLAIIVLFFVLAGSFQCLNRRVRSRNVHFLMLLLYISMVLILIRCIYRLVENIGGAEADIDDPESIARLSPLRRYEWWFYVFETTLVFLNSVLWNIWHAARYLPDTIAVYVSEDGSKEMTGEEIVEPRTVGKTIAHVLSFGQLFRKKREIKRVEDDSEP